MLVWLFVEHHNGLPVREFNLFFLNLAVSVSSSVFLWLLYVALEPFVRRRWPGWIISWSRLLTGDYRDPLVGRDILIGAVMGAGILLTFTLASVAPQWRGQASWIAINPGSDALGSHLFFTRFSEQLFAALFQALIFVFLLLLFVIVVRSEWVALFALWLLMAVITTLLTSMTPTVIPFTALSSFLVVFALKRYGLLAASSALFCSHLGVFYPVTAELTAWYATDFTIALIICVALAGYAFYTSLGGQKLLSGKLLEE